MTEPEHLTKERLNNTQRREHRQNEYSCLECGAAVTVNPHSGTEYGHWGDCIHRPDELGYAEKRKQRV